MNKDVWSYFKHFGRLLVKFICSPLPARLMKRFPASKGHLQPDLLGSFPADVGHRAKFSPSGGGRGLIGNWVWPKGYIYPFSGDGVGGGGERLRGFWQIAHSSYPTHQITSDTRNFPISKDILFCPNHPASKNLPEEQIFWGTDPLGAPVSSNNNKFLLLKIFITVSNWHWFVGKIEQNESSRSTSCKNVIYIYCQWFVNEVSKS